MGKDGRTERGGQWGKSGEGRNRGDQKEKRGREKEVRGREGKGRGL